MIGTELPQFVRDLLSSVPRRGDGLNLWLFRTARVLHPYRNVTDIHGALTAATAGEPVKRGEIERAIERSKAFAWQPGDSGRALDRRGAWPAINAEQRETVIAAGGGLADLWEVSPIRFDDTEPHAEEIIDALFPSDSLLCVARTNALFATRRREAWCGRLAGMQLLVPSPMIARLGRTQDGKPSEHTLENTGPRRFLVIEQDAGSVDEQAAVLLHLAESAPLALAVHSGSKSIHGWFFCEGQPESRLRAFMRLAVTLGADRAMWTRSQFARMPDGHRDNGKKQTVYFFNPEAAQ